MGYRSYTAYDCSVPDTTVLHGEIVANDAWDFVTFEHVGNRYEIHHEGRTGFIDDILEELIELFQMSLDKVPGLALDCHYETDEDEHWECSLHIKDGKCVYEEAEIRMVKRPMDECLINIWNKED